MKPTNNYVAILRLESKNTKPGEMIFLPEAIVEDSCWGWVVGVGEGIPDINGKVVPPPYKEGDLIYFAKYSNVEIDYSPEGLKGVHMVHEGDILLKAASATLKEDPQGFSQSVIPVGNFVRIEPLVDSVQKVTTGGIILAEQAIKRPTKARVISVGAGQRTVTGYHTLPVSPGDIVRYIDRTFVTISFKDLGVDVPDTCLISYGDIVAIETEEAFKSLKDSIAKMSEVVGVR